MLTSRRGQGASVTFRYRFLTYTACPRTYFVCNICRLFLDRGTLTY